MTPDERKAWHAAYGTAYAQDVQRAYLQGRSSMPSGVPAVRVADAETVGHVVRP